MTNFFIHIADPHFREAPWPGQRRLGPFLTLFEASEQAASDMSVGMGQPLGIWTEDDSNAARLDEDIPERKPTVTAEQIAQRAQEMTKERERNRAVDQESLRGGLRAAGIPADALDAAVKLVEKGR